VNTDLILRMADRASETAPAPASAHAVASAETTLGFSLPPLLKSLYRKVGNGGFGPGYAVLGVAGGHLTDEGDTLAELVSVFSTPDPDDPAWAWPAGLVPICHWGCAIYSCVDCMDPDYRVVWFDPNGREQGSEMEAYFMPHRASLESWFTGWLDGDDLWAETFGPA